MTNTNHDELKSPPPMHKPQWIAAVHQRQEERRTRRLWFAGGLALSLAMTLLWVVTSGQQAALRQRPVRAATDLDTGKLASHCLIESGHLSCHGLSLSKPSKEASRQSARNAALEQLAWYLTNQAMELNPGTSRPLPKPPKSIEDSTVIRGVGIDPLDYLVIVRGQVIMAAHAKNASAADAQALEAWQAEMAARMLAIMGGVAITTEQWRWTESERKIGSFEFLSEFQIDLSLDRMGELIELIGESPDFPLAMWTEEE